MSNTIESSELLSRGLPNVFGSYAGMPCSCWQRMSTCKFANDMGEAVSNPTASLEASTIPLRREGSAWGSPFGTTVH